MIAHVICCNDSVEYVVLNDEKAAEKKKEELKENILSKKSTLI